MLTKLNTKNNLDLNGWNLQGMIIFTSVAFTRRTIPLFYHTFEAVEIVS